MLQKTHILIGLLVFLNVFSGCSGLQKEPVRKSYFDLDTTGPALNQNTLSGGNPLLVKEFFITPAFDSYSFVYRLGNARYATDYYNEFISSPARLITEKIAETLYATNRFNPVPANTKQDICYRLSGKIIRLYGDLRKTGAPEAVIEISIILEKRKDKDFQAVFNKTYLAEEPILSHMPDQLVSGWNTGLSKIAGQLVSDLAAPAL